MKLVRLVGVVCWYDENKFRLLRWTDWTFKVKVTIQVASTYLRLKVEGITEELNCET
jgi:hypothetical protein